MFGLDINGIDFYDWDATIRNYHEKWANLNLTNLYTRFACLKEEKWKKKKFLSSFLWLQWLAWEQNTNRLSKPGFFNWTFFRIYVYRNFVGFSSFWRNFLLSFRCLLLQFVAWSFFLPTSKKAWSTPPRPFSLLLASSLQKPFLGMICK